MKIKVVKHDRNYLGPDYLDPLLLYTVLQPIITNRLLCGPPTILPPNDLPSSMQLQRSINTGPNPQWCKLSFQIKVVHFEERGVLSPQVWAAPPAPSPDLDKSSLLLCHIYLGNWHVFYKTLPQAFVCGSILCVCVLCVLRYLHIVRKCHLAKKIHSSSCVFAT